MVTQKDELAQALDFQRYAYLRDLLGLVPSPRTQEGIQELLRILTPTRDAESTRLVSTAYNAVKTTGTVDDTTTIAATVAAGLFWIVDACHCVHNDPTDRATNIHLQLVSGPTNFGQLAYDAALSQNNSLVVGRRFIVPEGHAVECQVNALTAGDSVDLYMNYWELSVGDYLLIP